MKNEKPNYLSKEQIDGLRAMLNEREEALFTETEAIRRTRLALEEIDRARESAKVGSIALDWQAFCQEVDAKDKEIGDILKEAVVSRFDYPRVWLSLPEDLAIEKQSAVSFRLKPFLQTFTAAKYGQAFRVKIRR